MLKRLVLASTLLFAAVPAFTQSPAPAAAVVPVAYQHCLLVSRGDAYASATMQLEYGQKAKTPVQDAQLAQDNEAVAKLGSAVSALNYMSLRGWECIGVSTITSKDGAYSNHHQLPGGLLTAPAGPVESWARPLGRDQPQLPGQQPETCSLLAAPVRCPSHSIAPTEYILAARPPQ